jgi:hypothetical protein
VFPLSPQQEGKAALSPSERALAVPTAKRVTTEIGIFLMQAELMSVPKSGVTPLKTSHLGCPEEGLLC